LFQVVRLPGGFGHNALNVAARRALPKMSPLYKKGRSL